MRVDERFATILPAPRTTAPPEATAIYVARLLALAVELRAGLLALADAETAWERRWPWLQAAKVLGYVVERLEETR